MNKIPRFETERLTLTWPTLEQVDGYYHAIIGSNMFDTIHWDGPSGLEELQDYWKSSMKTDPVSLETALDVAIVEKSSFQYIGGASLRPVYGDPAIIDIGYALAPKFHGKGYATEAVGALVTEAFAHRKAERIFANVFVGNHASRRVVEKLGFVLEGTHRRATLKRGKWLDQWMLAITRPDWEQR